MAEVQQIYADAATSLLLKQNLVDAEFVKPEDFYQIP